MRTDSITPYEEWTLERGTLVKIVRVHRNMKKLRIQEIDSLSTVSEILKRWLPGGIRWNFMNGN